MEEKKNQSAKMLGDKLRPPNLLIQAEKAKHSIKQLLAYGEYKLCKLEISEGEKSKYQLELYNLGTPEFEAVLDVEGIEETAVVNCETETEFNRHDPTNSIVFYRGFQNKGKAVVRGDATFLKPIIEAIGISKGAGDKYLEPFRKMDLEKGLSVMVEQGLISSPPERDLTPQKKDICDIVDQFMQHPLDTIFQGVKHIASHYQKKQNPPL